MSGMKEMFERELDQLRQARDELRVQLHLAKAEARDEWARLETKWEEVEVELERMRDHAQKPLDEMGGAARALLRELKSGYDRMRTRL